jgi:hypothetical protein
MSEDLPKIIAAWATEIAACAAELPSLPAREGYLAGRRGELVAAAAAEGVSERHAAVLADTCVNAARTILSELLAQRAGVPEGRA